MHHFVGQDLYFLKWCHLMGAQNYKVIQYELESGVFNMGVNGKINCGVPP